MPALSEFTTYGRVPLDRVMRTYILFSQVYEDLMVYEDGPHKPFGFFVNNSPLALIKVCLFIS